MEIAVDVLALVVWTRTFSPGVTHGHGEAEADRQRRTVVAQIAQRLSKVYQTPMAFWGSSGLASRLTWSMASGLPLSRGWSRVVQLRKQSFSACGSVDEALRSAALFLGQGPRGE